MCRIAAYVGDSPVTLGSLLYDAPHSLQQMAHSPRELLRGRVNVDGTGVAWWDGRSDSPLRYVTTEPPWSDPNLPHLASRLEASTILAAVRSATPGMPFGPSSVAPFVDRGMAGVHNGWIAGFREGVGRRLIEGLGDERFAQMTAMNDSLALFLLIAQEVEESGGASVADALGRVVEKVAKVLSSMDQVATLNLVVATRGELVATRTSVGFELNSLYARQAGGQTWLASERLDDSEGWKSLPEHSIAVFSSGEMEVDSLEHAGVDE